MRLLYRDSLFDAQFLRTLGHSCYGGADIGECWTTARAVREKDLMGWFSAWMELAGRVRTEGELSLQRGHTISACDSFLRASNYYRNSYVFLFGKSSDRVQRAYDLQRQSFRQAAALMHRVEEVKIPYERTTLSGYFLRAGDDNAPRPTLIINGGYDSTAEECYFWNAAAAVRRGYHCLIFDGPGQGSALIEQGLPLRPDWEHVISPIMDWLQRRTGVDGQRIGLIGESLGGYLALRAASGEPRLAACIADPGQFGLLEIMRRRIPRFMAKGVPELRGLPGLLLRKIMYSRLRKPTAGWGLRRGLFVHKVATLEQYIGEIAKYSLAGRVARIQCPTLVCYAEDDDIAASAKQIFDALACEKNFLTFRGSEGAGEHCEAGARLLFHQRAIDWLDEKLLTKTSPKEGQ